MHRYLRLTPVLILIMLFSITIMKFMGDGPLWKFMYDAGLYNNCVKNWWSMLLYMQNYLHPNEMVRTAFTHLILVIWNNDFFFIQCLGHTWYLAVDTQLFLIAPFLIYLLYHYKEKIIVLIVALVVLSSGWTLYLYIYYQFLGRWIDSK